jgi:hypothetical protein
MSSLNKAFPLSAIVSAHVGAAHAFGMKPKEEIRLVEDRGVDGDGTCAMALQLAAKGALK